jgi:cytochrome d ubiquinol oxidase subunit II
MKLGDLIGFVMIVSLVFYALGAGADFGGGVWDLLASGPRARRQRELIAHAIGPIWEANHVWLILVIVLLFVAFPPAFAAASIALHIPLAVMLVGIVLRGSAFIFRSHDVQTDEVQRNWGRLFAVGSIVAPIMLGTCVGAIASGSIRVDLDTGKVHTNFISQWLAPFPFAIGFWTLALFAFLAAVYLTNEADEPELREDFRRRALAAGLAVAFMALVSFVLAARGAPLIRSGLSKEWWSIPFQVITGLASVSALASVWKRRYQLARVLAMTQIALIIAGWGLAQFPFLIGPDLTFANAVAPDSVLRVLIVALAAGALLLFPSLWYLFRVFKTPAQNQMTNDK